AAPAGKFNHLRNVRDLQDVQVVRTLPVGGGKVSQVQAPNFRLKGDGIQGVDARDRFGLQLDAADPGELLPEGMDGTADVPDAHPLEGLPKKHVAPSNMGPFPFIRRPAERSDAAG